MDELEELRVRAGMAQPLDHAEGDSAAAVHGESGRLVERDQRLVLEQHRRNVERARRGRGAPAWAPRSGWGESAASPRSASRVSGPTRAAIDPHFAAAQNPVDVAFGHPFQHFLQEVVDPLAVAVLPNHEPVHGILA